MFKLFILLIIIYVVIIIIVVINIFKENLVHNLQIYMLEKPVDYNLSGR